MTQTQDVAASSRFYVFGLALLTIVSGVAAVLFALGGGGFGAAILGAGAVMSGWGVYRSCYGIKLSDGYLVMRYLYRRRVVRLEEVRRIEFIESDEESSSPEKFVVSLDDGSSFRVAANRSTRGMMESIVQRQPDVVVIGTIWPLTKLPPPTQQDDEFWSGGSRT